MIIERDAFLSGLSAVRRIVIRNSPIPILQNLRLEAVGGKLTLLAHSRDACTTVAVAAEGDLGAITTPCEMLHGLVNALPRGSHVTIVLDKDRLILTSGKSKYRLQTLPAADFPLALEVKGEATGVVLGKDDIAELFKRGMFAVETDTRRIYLCGAYLHSHGGMLSSGITDGKRAFRASVGIKFAGHGAIVDMSSCAEIARMDGNEITLHWDERIITVTSGNLLYASKLIDGSYPDFDRVVSSYDQAGYLECDCAELQAASVRIAVVAGPHLMMTWDTDPSMITIESPEGGREEIACTSHNMKAGMFGVSPGYLRQAAGLVTGETVRLYWRAPDEPIKIVDPRDPNLFFIQTPRYRPAHQAAA